MKYISQKYKVFTLYWFVTLNVTLIIFTKLFNSTLLFDLILLLSATLTIAFLVWGVMTKFLVEEDIVPIIVLSVALCLLFQSVTLNIDRSRSLFVLSWVQDGKVTESSDGDFLISGVISRESMNVIAIGQRLEEHEDRRLIEVKDGRAGLTQLGRVAFHAANLLANIYDLQGWKRNKF